MKRSDFLKSVTGAVAVAAITNQAASAADPVDAQELKRGGLYVLKVPGQLSDRAYEQVQKCLAPFKESHGVQFIVIEGGMRIEDPNRPTISVDPDDLAERVATKVIKAQKEESARVCAATKKFWDMHGGRGLPSEA